MLAELELEADSSPRSGVHLKSHARETAELRDRGRCERLRATDYENNGPGKRVDRLGHGLTHAPGSSRVRPCCTLHATRKAVLPGGAPALALRTTADGLAGTRGSACSGSLRCERMLVFTLAAECGVVASGVGRRKASPGLASEQCSETYAVLPRAAGKRLHGRVASDRTPVALRASREWRRNTTAHGSVSVAKLRPCSAVGRGRLRRRACAALQRARPAESLKMRTTSRIRSCGTCGKEPGAEWALSHILPPVTSSVLRVSQRLGTPVRGYP